MRVTRGSKWRSCLEIRLLGLHMVSPNPKPNPKPKPIPTLTITPTLRVAHLPVCIMDGTASPRPPVLNGASSFLSSSVTELESGVDWDWDRVRFQARISTYLSLGCYTVVVLTITHPVSTPNDVNDTT